MASAVDKANWMGALTDNQDMITKPLNTLAIPGSHDSFTYSLDESGPISNDEPAWMRAVGKLPFAKHIIYSWSVTQSWTVEQQLENGIRYFDVRTSHPDDATDPADLRVLHGLYGESIYSLMDKIRQFIDGHPKEVVIVDFNHFYNVSDDLHSQLIDFLSEKFNTKICPRAPTSQVTLEYCWEQAYQVLIFYRPSASVVPPDTFWTGDDMGSYWANTTDTQKLIQGMTDSLMDRSMEQFFDSGGNETEDAKTVIANLFGNLIDVLGESATKAVVDWLNANRTLFAPILNIVTVDCVDRHGFVDAVLAYNFGVN